jgi:hypothetical protein
LKSPTSSFLLRVDRDGRLAGSLKADHLCVDVLELRIAIAMAGSFAGFPVGLKTEAKTPQQPTNQFVAGHKATLDQRPGEMPLALADPKQGRRRIAANGRLDNLGKRFEQPRLPVNRHLAAAAGPATPPAEMVLAAAKLGQPATNRTARYRGRCAHRLDTALTPPRPAASASLAATSRRPLVKKRRYGVKT